MNRSITILGGSSGSREIKKEVPPALNGGRVTKGTSSIGKDISNSTTDSGG